jgi:hypothetical protein
MSISAAYEEQPGCVLQVAADGKLIYLCPAEPEPTLKSKGGRPQQAVRRVCLCNALFAAAGLPQRRQDGYVEPPIAGHTEPAYSTVSDPYIPPS